MRRGFPVPELLAVIAIIIILVSMILPLILKASDSTREVRCAVHLRSLSQATINYSIENSQWMPFTNWLSQENGGPPDWQGAGWLYDYPARTNPGDHRKGQLWPYVKEDSIYRCPVDAAPFKTGTTHMITSYLHNGAYSGFGSAPNHIYKRYQFKPDAIMFWEVDELAGGGSYNDGSSFPSEPVTKRHITGLTVASHDGHTDWLTYVEFQALLSDAPGRLWCKPGSANGK